MKLLLPRYYDNKNDTLGLLYFRNHLSDIKYVYTLEDEFRDIKKTGETRIPAGFYDVVPRKGGRVYEALLKSKIEIIRSFTDKYGVLEIMNVLNFSSILFHPGNIEKDTDGCVLVGNMVNNNSKESAFLSDSINAYADLVSATGFWLDNRESIRLEIKDTDKFLL